LNVVLTVAGSDSGGGAGIQADLKTIAAHGLHGASAVAAITAQNTQAVLRWEVLPADLVVAQIEAVVRDMRVAAVKTGMLASAEVIEAVAEALSRHHLPNVVVDPVLRASTGADLVSGDAVRAYLERLLPLATVVTPNLAEASALLATSVRTLEDMRRAAGELRRTGARAVVVKGGHLEGEPVDVLAGPDGVVELGGERVAGPGAHGTGCVFSAALASRLARGETLLEATRGAKAYVTAALRAAVAVGAGRPLLPPVLRYDS
jgi:hydroxymethylpyrimidine/phosphomethylpyrimidine kinase